MGDTATDFSSDMLSFCGEIVDVRAGRQGGIEVVMKDATVLISSPKDKGLSFLPIGERRHFVVENGKILAVYIRFRIKLLKAVGAGQRISDKFLISLRPSYPADYSRLEKRLAKGYFRRTGTLITRDRLLSRFER